MADMRVSDDGTLASPPLGEPLVDVEDTPAHAPPANRWLRLLLAVSLILIAFNLRTVFSSLSTVLPEVMRAFGMTPSMASVLTTLPVLCLGLFSFPTPGLARRYGAERVILGCLLAVVAGNALRGFAVPPVLFAGTFLAGAGIAMVNVLLPGLVKRDFPKNIAAMTGLYTMALCGGAATAAALTVPLSKALGGWPQALAAWAVPALVVLGLWLPQALSTRHDARAGGARVGSLLGNRLAWQVTLFMGLQSAMAYIVFGWLAPILRERGLDAVTSGLVLSVSIMVQMGACLAAPALAMRGRDQRPVVLALELATIIGFIGCYALPLWSVWIWSVLLGMGQGGLLAVAMTIIILRSPDVHVAAKLSGMAQGFGYIIAATGPLLVGVLRDASGSYFEPTVLFVAFGVTSTLCGLAAGRNRLVTKA
jgi:CP family cyanate transporter-like MFS transporter